MQLTVAPQNEGSKGKPFLNWKERVARLKWVHSIDLGHGIVTPGEIGRAHV